MRDMVQNHLFQLMALIAMEPPAALDAISIRDEKGGLYESVRPLKPNIRRLHRAGTSIRRVRPTGRKPTAT